MGLSNINLFPEPDPFLTPTQPPNPDVMQALNAASGPLFTDTPPYPQPENTFAPNYDAPAYRADGLLNEPIHPPAREPSIVEESSSKIGGEHLNFSNPKQSQDNTPVSSPLGGLPVNNMKPVAPPRPVTGIQGYGTPGTVPFQGSAGSMHSSALEREDRIDASMDAQQTKGHAAVEQAFTRDIEQGRQRSERISQQQAQREFDKTLKGEKPKTPGSKLPKKTKSCPRCEEANIDMNWKMCMPCMQRLLLKIEKKVGLAE